MKSELTGMSMKPRWHLLSVIARSHLRSVANVVAFLLLVSCAFAANGTARGVESRGSGIHPAIPPIDFWNRDWAIADFDDDQKPDWVHSEATEQCGAALLYRVKLRLSGNEQGSFFDVAVSHRTKLNISVRDVDADRDLDLVITAGILRERVGIWINDGAGSFTEADVALFPESIWRDPPGVGSDERATQNLNAIVEQRCTGLVRTENLSFPLPAGNMFVAGRRFVEIKNRLASGQTYTRPPPDQLLFPL